MSKLGWQASDSHYPTKKGGNVMTYQKPMLNYASTSRLLIQATDKPGNCKDGGGTQSASAYEVDE
jgi:hypothetical protein